MSIEHEVGVASEVALVGGTGFIGQAVMSKLLRSDCRIRLLVRPSSKAQANSRVTHVRGRLRDQRALRELVAGAGAVIHAASYVGEDPVRQELVNVGGTRNLVSAVRKARVPRFLYISTSGVYGTTKLDGRNENEFAPAPRSRLSASRRTAELMILDMGGLVVRPHMTFGVGDNWFLSAYTALILRVGAWVNGGHTKVSAIDRDTLASAVIDLVHAPAGAGVFHAAYRKPVPMRRLALPILQRAGLQEPLASLDPNQAMQYAAAHNIPAPQMSIVAYDNSLDARKLWSTVSTQSPPEPVLSKEALSWYADRLDPQRFKFRPSRDQA